MKKLDGGLGGDSKGVEGFWIAKYEMSMETNGSHTETTNSTAGNIATENAGGTAGVKIASKPRCNKLEKY